MAISDDEDTAMHAMSDNDDGDDNVMPKSKAPVDVEPPQALPGALHGHELDNLPWYIAIPFPLVPSMSSLQPVSCPAFGAAFRHNLDQATR
jgi:hypothetical protein